MFVAHYISKKTEAEKNGRAENIHHGERGQLDNPQSPLDFAK